MPTRHPIDALREAKHWASKKWWWGRLSAKSTALGISHRVRPFHFDEQRYYNTFLAIDAPPRTRRIQESAPNVVWCVWTGDNEISENRRAGLESIHEENPDAEVILVTPENLDKYVVDSEPLHPIYPHLSLVHRSDYLRSYLLYHHGGAYTDIKRQRGSMSEAIAMLNSDPDLWLVAGPIPQLPAAIDQESALERECRHNFDILPSSAAFALKAGSPLVHEWYHEVQRRCDYFLESASRNPGGVWGLWHPNVHDTKYPIHWNVLQANVLEPLCLKYQPHIRLEDRFRPHLSDYR